MAKCGKCDPHEICEECPEWIFTLADLIMCMMGLFVLLWVLKPSPGQPSTAAEDEKWLETVGEIRKGFGYRPEPGSKDPVDLAIQRNEEKRRRPDPPFKGPGEGAESQEPKQGATGTDPLVTVVRPGTYVTTGGKMLFAQGDATLAAETQKGLDEIVRLIRGHRNIIQVKGHTSLDDFPEGATPPQRMDLSLRRAQAAADYLTSHGVSPDIVRVQGCSTFEPVVQRVYGPDAQAANRRVEVEATDALVPERQDQNQPSAALLPADGPATPARTAAIE